MISSIVALVETPSRARCGTEFASVSVEDSMKLFAYTTTAFVLCISSLAFGDATTNRHAPASERMSLVHPAAPAPNLLDPPNRLQTPLDSYANRLLTQPRLGDSTIVDPLSRNGGVPASAPTAPETDMLPP